MAHYAYKYACYDIDYEKYKALVAEFEKVERRKHDGDSNYDGDNWYIMAMWIQELRAEVERLKHENNALACMRIAEEVEHHGSLTAMQRISELEAEITKMRRNND